MAVATAQQILGFGESLSINYDVNEYLQQVNLAARERGIALDEPSDALDMSRDVILDEAAAKCGLNWEIIDGTLCLTPQSLKVDWRAYLKAEAEAEKEQD